MPENQQGRFESGLKLVSPLLAVAAFVWGIYTYRENARQQLAREETEAKRAADTRRIEVTRPYLDKQLALYTEATKVTVTIATSADGKEIEKATRRFWELYWGELSLVEHGGVEAAMVRFGDALNAKKEKDELAQLALALARACREELATSWGTEAWKR
jgi:hypothetical protein